MGRPVGDGQGGATWPGMGTVVRRGLIKHRRRMTAAFPSEESAESLRSLEAGDDFALGPAAMWSALYAAGHPAETEFRFAHREANAGRVWEVRGADLVELSPEEAAGCAAARCDSRAAATPSKAVPDVRPRRPTSGTDASHSMTGQRGCGSTSTTPGAPHGRSR